MLPLLLAGRVKMVDNVTLRNQLTSLERRPGDNTKEQVSHPPNGHDDVCCAVAGAICASLPPDDGSYDLSVWMAVNGWDDQSNRELAAQRLANSVSRPISGPQAPGAVDLGSGGYKAANFWNPTTAADDQAWERHREFMTGERRD